MRTTTELGCGLGEFVAEDHTAFHHVTSPLQNGDVAQRISVVMYMLLTMFCVHEASPLLAMVEAVEADYLVTGEKRDLLMLENHGSTRIVTAREQPAYRLRVRPPGVPGVPLQIHQISSYSTH